MDTRILGGTANEELFEQCFSRGCLVPNHDRADDINDGAEPMTVHRESENTDNDTNRSTRFVELLTSHQRDLYAYINAMLVGDPAAADVLQDTNLDLWARLGDYDWNRPFLPWAYGFAYQRILAFRKTRSRARLVFNDDVLELVSDVYIGDAHGADVRLSALKQCLDKLAARESELVRERYIGKMSVKMLASRLGRSANQVSVHLYRIRHGLAKCVEATLALEG